MIPKEKLQFHSYDEIEIKKRIEELEEKKKIDELEKELIFFWNIMRIYLKIEWNIAKKGK